jgi:phosphoribosylamine--glycine ligase
VFHSGTAERDGRIVTAGGRVLCVTALGESVRESQAQAYAAIERIRFDGMHYRHDIGRRAALRERSS